MLVFSSSSFVVRLRRPTRSFLLTVVLTVVVVVSGTSTATALSFLLYIIRVHLPSEGKRGAGGGQRTEEFSIACDYDDDYSDVLVG